MEPLPFETESNTPSIQTELFEKVGSENSNPTPQTAGDDSPHIHGTVQCSFCGGSISREDESTHSEIVSWVHGKKKDSPVLRVYTGRLACGHCIARLCSGVDPNHPELFEALESSPESAIAEDPIPTDEVREYKHGYKDGLAGSPVLLPGSRDYIVGYRDGEQEKNLKALLWSGSSKLMGPPDEEINK